MDIVHDFIADSLHEYFPAVHKDSIFTQIGIYYGILSVGGMVMYLFFASLSYWFFFMWKAHLFYPDTIPKEKLAAQRRHEISISLNSLPFMAILMLPFPVLSYRGYSRIYRDVDDYGWAYFFFSIPFFLFFTDGLIYFVHRGLHHPLIYKRIHKPHHTYRWTTPFSSHAFHPIDGFSQGVPYYLFIFIFPFHNLLWVAMFLFVNFWTIAIHDQVDFGFFNRVINSTDHHTIHHVDFLFNYGQYFTFWDRLGGSYRPAKQTHTFWGERVAPPPKDAGKAKGKAA
eukprot:EG_transcript_15802